MTKRAAKKPVKSKTVKSITKSGKPRKTRETVAFPKLQPKNIVMHKMLRPSRWNKIAESLELDKGYPNLSLAQASALRFAVKRLGGVGMTRKNPDNTFTFWLMKEIKPQVLPSK